LRPRRSSKNHVIAERPTSTPHEARVGAAQDPDREFIGRRQQDDPRGAQQGRESRALIRRHDGSRVPLDQDTVAKGHRLRCRDATQDAEDGESGHGFDE
jgi:hypothetical protein